MLRQKALEHNPPAFDVDIAKEARRPAASSEMSRNLGVPGVGSVKQCFIRVSPSIKRTRSEATNY